MATKPKSPSRAPSPARPTSSNTRTAASKSAINASPSPTAASTLVPDPPSKEIDLLSLDAGLRDVITSYYDDYRAARNKAEYYDRLRKDAADNLQSILADAGYGRVCMGDGRVVVLCRGRSASVLSATRLAELGVDADLITRARVPGNVYWYVQVRDLKDEEADREHIRRSAAVKGGQRP